MSFRTAGTSERTAIVRNSVWIGTQNCSRTHYCFAILYIFTTVLSVVIARRSSQFRYCMCARQLFVFKLQRLVRCGSVLPSPPLSLSSQLHVRKLYMIYSHVYFCRPTTPLIVAQVLAIYVPHIRQSLNNNVIQHLGMDAYLWVDSQCIGMAQTHQSRNTNIILFMHV